MGKHVGRELTPPVKEMLELLEDGMLHTHKEIADIFVRHGRNGQQAKPTLNHYAGHGKVAQYARGVYGKPGLGPNAVVSQIRVLKGGDTLCPCCYGKGFLTPEEVNAREGAKE